MRVLQLTVELWRPNFVDSAAIIFDSGHMASAPTRGQRFHIFGLNCNRHNNSEGGNASPGWQVATQSCSDVLWMRYFKQK